MPLAGDFDFEVKGQETDFQTGITALSKIAQVNVGISSKSQNETLRNLKDATVTAWQGPCPAANVGVHVNHLCPVNKGEVVWTVDPVAV